MPISKREFCAAQGLGYEMQDRETNTRYDLVLPWIPTRTDLIVREVGCKFGVLRDKLAQVVIQNYGAVDIDQHTIDRIPDKKPGQFSVHDVNQGLLLNLSGLRLIERKGTYTRLPFAKRLFGRDILFRTQFEFFTRSYLYRIGTIDG